MSAALKAPFPWFGGKSRAAHLVWAGFGDVANYVEPFAGSLAVLLGRPTPARIETVNDLDCYVANFWRAVKWAPDEVAFHADWPVNEADLHARHRDLVTRDEFRRRMKREPKFFDAEIAGWWVWGICQWIGGGWCAASNWDANARRPRGTNTAEEERRTTLLASMGVHRKTTDYEGRTNAGRRGRGGLLADKRARDLTRSAEWAKRPQLGKGGRGDASALISEQLPMISGDSGASGRGIHASAASQGPISSWMHALAARLRRVRVCCGDWRRVLGRSSTECIGTTGIFFDPPYSAAADRDPSLYSCEDLQVAHEVREWAIEHGANRKLRIALCGYEGEHEMPKSWECVPWKAVGGYAASAGNTENSHRERIWFSPACAEVKAQHDLFEVAS